MERVRWTEKPITFRSLVDNPAIPKPALAQIGTKTIVVGEKINGEFITAAPCKVSDNRCDVIEQEIVLSSKHTGIWRVISKSTSKKEGYIHRLTTKDIERIYKKDVKNERATPRSYICTKEIEAFELHIHPNDSTVVSGQRGVRRKKNIEENVEFEIVDFGEVEYTPTEGERTSQDYVTVAKKKSGAFLQLFIPGMQSTEQLIRNRVLSTLYCTTKNEARKRWFLLEVNEQPSDIRPIASEGSTELRYLHSTQNLFDYMLNYGNDTFLYVKLLRGDPPIKAIDFDGYMVFKRAFHGDRIPICQVDNREVTLVTPDLPVRVKLPTGDHPWHSFPEIRAAELQCMQLSLALLSRHESEMYVTMETERNIANYLQSNDDDQEQRSTNRRTSASTKKHLPEREKSFDNPKSISKSQNDVRSGQTKITKQETTHSTKPLTLSHPVSDRLYRDNARRASQELFRTERPPHIEQEEKSNQKQRASIREKSTTSSSNNSRTKANVI